MMPNSGVDNDLAVEDRTGRVLHADGGRTLA